MSLQTTDGWSPEVHPCEICVRPQCNTALLGRHGFRFQTTITDQFETDEVKSLWQFMLTDTMAMLCDQIAAGSTTCKIALNSGRTYLTAICSVIR